jgi:nitrile hydratase
VGCLPAFPVPEVVAHDLGDTAEWCYRVRFDADALWGEDGHPSDAVYLDVWERDLIPIADEEGASA